MTIHPKARAIPTMTGATKNEETKRPVNPRKKMIKMASIDKDMVCSTTYRMSIEEPLPELPDCAVRVKVCFAGACSPDVKRQRSSVRNKGIMDTSLFPGYEVAGIVDTVGEQAKTDLVSGDRVMVYPDEDIGYDGGFSEYIIINHPENLVRVPEGMKLEVAALLPTGGLTAYTAIMRARSYIRECEDRKDKCNILVVGAGGLGLWATIMASHLTANPGTCDLRVNVIVADTNSAKLKVAREHGCYGVVHWPSNAYEEQLVERTRNACPDGIDVVIDFVSSPRTIARALKFLNKRGVLVVSGTSQHEVQFNLSELAQNEQTIIGVRKGTKEELAQLITLVDAGMISTPQFKTFQLEDADSVFQDLSDCKINGRAVLQVSPTAI